MQHREKLVALIAAIAATGYPSKVIATRANISAGCLSEICNRRVNPKPATRKAIANALGCSVKSLFAEVT